MERLAEIRAALATVRAPVFLAQRKSSRRGDRIALHITDAASSGYIRKKAETALKAVDGIADCRIIVHKPATLAGKRSLEAFTATFREGEMVFDPTGVIGRALAVSACATAVRKALGARAAGVFIDTTRRTLFVILDRKQFPAEGEAALRERGAAMQLLGATVETWRASQPNAIALAIRVGFDLPAGVVLVPVDRLSERLAKRSLLERLRKPGIAATLASVMGIGSVGQALAADATLGSQPGVLSNAAVAAPNLGLIAGGGELNGSTGSEGWGAVGLKATIPLGEHFGAQVDAGVGADSYAGIGGHLFWRDPGRGMLGVVASSEQMAGATLSRFAVEGEVYKDDFTLRGKIGAESGTGTATGGVFGSADVTFYATPNLALSVGGEVGPTSFGRALIEWQPAIASLPGLSLFADGEIGSGGSSKVLAGLKYYFGTNGVSLKDRDRHYDPDFSLFNTQSLRTVTVGNGYGYGANPI